jgi:MFS family permease
MVPAFAVNEVSLNRKTSLAEQKQQKNPLWLPAILLILVQMASGIRDLPQTSFFLIYLQEQLSLGPVAISGIVSGAQITGMVMALLGGALVARLGSKWALACGLALSAVGSLAFQAHSFWLVALLWFVGGAGLALVSVGGASYLTRINSRGVLGTLAAFYALSMTAGGAVGNPIAGVLIEKSGFVTYSWTIIGISSCTLLMVIFAMPHLQGYAAGPVPISSFWSEVVSTARQRNVQLLVGLRCLPTLFYGMLTVLLPLLIHNLSGSKAVVAAYGTTNLVVASAAQLLAGRAADRWGAKRPTIAAYSVLIFAGLGLALSTGMLPGTFIFGVIGIAAAWSLSTLMYIWVNDGVATEGHPSTFGLLHAVWSFSMVSGSMLGSWFLSFAQWLPFLVGSLLNTGSLFLIHSFYSKPRMDEASSQQEIQQT